jgi:hypothetical protein
MLTHHAADFSELHRPENACIFPRVGGFSPAKVPPLLRHPADFFIEIAPIRQRGIHSYTPVQPAREVVGFAHNALGSEMFFNYAKQFVDGGSAAF